MYKVFNDSQKIIIAKSDSLIDFGEAITICIKDPKDITQIMDRHVFTNNSLDLVLLSNSPKNLISSFENNCKIHIAAGGWVFNKQKQLLMIKRNDKWDIPKGHAEKGETIEETALREVMEETGIDNLTIQQDLGISQHIYFHKSKVILKKTNWFLMQSDFKGLLLPQVNEGITKAKWIKREKIEKKLKKGWLSLLDFYQKENIARFIS